MPQWLPTGGALLVGAHLLNPTTGTWTALPVPADAALAGDPDGGVVALVPGREGAAPALVWMRVGAQVEVMQQHTIDGLAPAGWRWMHAPLPGGVWVWASGGVSANDGWDEACALVRPERDGPPSVHPQPCPPHSFAEVYAIVGTPAGGLVVASAGEGHPGVDLLAPDANGGFVPVQLPWEDLYPFGPMDILPRADGSFDLMSPCPLGPPRPCLATLDRVDLPDRWTQWTPGGALHLRARGRRAAVWPDPTTSDVAWARGASAVDGLPAQLCVGPRRGKGRCFSRPGSD